MRKWLLAGLGAAVVGVTGLLVAPSFSKARLAARAQDEGPKHTPLSIGQVVLFSSGVGFFQREGTVDGDARIDLSFPVADVNDLLKSMVLRDRDGGHVAAVSYDSNAPLERTLQSFAVNLTANPALAKILDQARGEKVEVALSAAGAGQPATLTGTVVGVETQKQAAGKDAAVDVSVLNLWCADGLRGVRLPDVQRVRLLNPALDSEFRKALEALAQSHDAQKKAVSLSFTGEGKRRVSVGYVVDNPLWKTSYRLVLGGEKQEKPYLQGWAVVENSSDEDWRGVRMALVSGRPVSFRMDLYTPLFVPRPLVEPELFASLRPPSYSGALNGVPAMAQTAPAPPPSVPAGPGQASRNGRRAPSGGFRGGERADMPVNRLEEKEAEASRAFGVQLDQRMDLAQGVASAANAAKLGDFFRYAIDHPV